IILVFIVGIRYGQRVEKTNKIINYLISLPPTQIPQPTQKPLEFKNYSNKHCGIEFLYPQNLQLKDSSLSAVFKENDQEQIMISCEKDNKLLAILVDEAVATDEAIFKNKKISIRVPSRGHVYDIYVFKIANPKNLKTIFVRITKSLYPLFEKSFEFIQ
ncbi:hypothetical protein HY407_00445, partial [Candidatus Gottesmanbacteria bacterium]|nr:hypothetical protein [Candidatus Gottesmanbacteria bacterium]